MEKEGDCERKKEKKNELEHYYQFYLGATFFKVLKYTVSSLISHILIIPSLILAEREFKKANSFFVR